MGLPNNVRVAMAIEGRTCEFVRRLRGKCGYCRCSSTGLWLTCLTFGPKCTGTFWVVSMGLWLTCLTFDPKCTGTFWAVSMGLWLTCLTFECSPTHSRDETFVDRFNVTMVTLSSSLDDVLLLGVGSEAGSQAETKCLHLFANP
jgi:hypothetical protein